MKINCKLEVSDETRNALAVLVAGKPVKRLATRDEVGEFVRGALDALTGEPPLPGEVLIGFDPETKSEKPTAAASPLTAAEQAHADKLTAEGKSAGYIRGWLVAGRVIERART